MKITGEHIARRFGDTVICIEREMTRKIPKLTRDFRRANDNLIAVVTAGEGVSVQRARRAALAVSSVIAENGGFLSDTFVVDLHEEVDGSPSARATLSRGFANGRDDHDLQEAVACCVPAD